MNGDDSTRRRGPRLLPWVALALGGGCYVGADAEVRDVGTAGSDTAGEDGDDDVGPDGQLCRAHESPLRRLTVRQYINTLEDLFPGQDFEDLGTLLPADAQLHGFENFAQLQVPSAALIEGYQRGALEVTRTVFSSPEAFEASTGLETPTSAEEANVAADAVIRGLGRRIFRRPVTDAEVERYGSVFANSFQSTGNMGDDFLVALSLTVSAMLQSPHFLYLLEVGEGGEDAQPGELVPLTPHEVASRLSYFLWDSMPDEELLAAAEADALNTPDAVEDQVRRMLEHPRGRAAVVNLHRQWLGFDDVLLKMKDPTTYPQWSEVALLDAHAQLERFVEHNFFEGEGTIRSLLTSSEVPMSRALAEIMGASVPEADWEVQTLDPAERRGVFTLPGFLAGHAHPVHPSPVLRGQFVRDRLLCAGAPPPPESVDATPPSGAGDGSTNRQRYDVFLENEACAGCHVLLHGVGYPFEIYDSIGAFRTTDAGKPVDPSGQLVGVPGLPDTDVSDALEMMDVLADADATRSCTATQFFRSGFGRDPEVDADACLTDDLVELLVESDGDLQELMVGLARSTDFRHRRIPQ